MTNGYRTGKSASASGYGTVGLQGGKPFLIIQEGTLDVQQCLVSGVRQALR